MKTALIFTLASFALLGACKEIPQDAAKPFAGAEETRGASAALAERAALQDEYPRTGGAAKELSVATRPAVVQ